MTRLLFALPLALFAAIAVYLTLGLDLDPRKIPSVLIDRPAPQFSLPGLPGLGDGLATDHLTGQPQLVNVFASWCGPCRIEHPVLMRLSQEAGIPVLGINYKDKPDDALAFLNETGNPYMRIGADRDGRVGIEWGVYGVPETFVIDATGRIRYKHVGPILPGDMEEKILPIIRELRGWPLS